MTTTFAFPQLAAEYARLWASMTILSGRWAEAEQQARRILAHRARYAAVEAATGAPWFVVGIIHMLEAGGDFRCHLHNGDPLTARTRQVPRGRPLAGAPPFGWEASACDALDMKRLADVPCWSAPRIAYELERYNGWGYRAYHAATPSPYLWAGSCHYRRGKYVADGKWDAAAVSSQTGGLVLLKALLALEPAIAAAIPDEPLLAAGPRPRVDAGEPDDDRVADPPATFERPAPATPASVTPGAIAAEGSRSMGWLLRMRFWSGWSGGGLLTFLGLDSLAGTRGALQEVRGMINENAELVLVVVLVLVAVAAWAGIRTLVAAAREGRYRPRGVAAPAADRGVGPA